MTHTTDQERAEFEKAWRERPIYMGGVHQKEVAYIWWTQAARRAPAAPVPQIAEVQDSLVAISAAIADQDDSAAQSMLRDLLSMLAAAPQPPESAQVQLPEPVGVAFTFEAEEGGPVSSQITSNPSLMPMGWTRIFTEQQVRQLLADNGIGKDKA